MTSILDIKHIPFLQISNPPSLYNLREAVKAAKKKSNVKTFQRWDVEKVEKKSLLESFSSFITVYVDIGELKRKSKDKERNSLVGITHPALTQLGTDKERIKKHAGAPQFAFGGYYYTDKLFLMEDIFEWSHHRISWSEIRTAKSIIEKLNK